jgi:hypothetical protein
VIYLNKRYIFVLPQMRRRIFSACGSAAPGFVRLDLRSFSDGLGGTEQAFPHSQRRLNIIFRLHKWRRDEDGTFYGRRGRI